MQTREILRIKGGTIYSVAPEATLTSALAIMVEKDIGSLVVLEHGELAGMLSFREVLRAASGHGGSVEGISVREAMVAAPLTVGVDMEIDDLRRTMIDSHVRYIPVRDGSALAGVLSFHDVARAMLEEQAFENRMLKGYLKNTMA